MNNSNPEWAAETLTSFLFKLDHMLRERLAWNYVCSTHASRVCFQEFMRELRESLWLKLAFTDGFFTDFFLGPIPDSTPHYHWVGHERFYFSSKLLVLVIVTGVTIAGRSSTIG